MADLGPIEVPEHCGLKMRLRSTQYTWEGLPNEGYSITTFHMVCTKECGVILDITWKEPS